VRLVTYDLGAGTPARVGVLRGDDVIDGGFEGDMTALIAKGDLTDVEAALDSGGPVAGARLRAPLRPRTLRDFLAFEGHAKAAMKALGRDVPELWYEVPAYYKGLPDTVIGPGDVIPWPRYSDKLDYELEIACVIGAEGSDIAKADAHRHIFGWTIWNDMSARDTQARELPLGMGPSKAKDWDGANILGPCIATADELDGFDAEERTRARSSQMHHSFADLIAYASQDTMLRPGEVIGSGTAPGGAGIESGRFLSEGDVIEMEIPGIGVLRNRVGARPA
jgi:2-keto-4-pentenoate hydratase/2-oxohepta-3-ene-1,7-dioic acid hydratase in catechol pathway